MLSRFEIRGPTYNKYYFMKYVGVDIRTGKKIYYMKNKKASLEIDLNIYDKSSPYIKLSTINQATNMA